MTPTPPKTIGRYAIVERLGQGGMGVVYRAWDPDLRRMVAVKVISGSREGLVDDRVFERFAREARSAASLAHPNIVTIHDFGRDASRRPYIVMELIEGESMAQMIRSSAPPSLLHRARLIVELCEGLAYAHEHGVVHRDIKPANLMITATGVLKILDFGLARLTDDLTETGLTLSGAVMGTPQYMSPEQVSGLPADARSDIFSVGTVMYELFTGRRAFEGGSAAVRLQILHDSPPAPGEIVPGFPDRLAAMVAKTLEKDRSRRYQRLDALAGELRDWEREAGALEGVARVAFPTPDAARTSGNQSGLADALGAWEDAVGRVLAAPTPNHARAPETRDRDDRSISAVTPPGRDLKHRYRTRRYIWVAIAVAALLGATGVYLAMRSRAFESSGMATPQAPQAVPAATGDRPVPPAREPREERAPIISADGGAPPPTSSNQTENADQPPISARCTEILQRVGIGEELTASDREFLTQRCRDRSR